MRPTLAVRTVLIDGTIRIVGARWTRVPSPRTLVLLFIVVTRSTGPGQGFSVGTQYVPRGQHGATIVRPTPTFLLVAQINNFGRFHLAPWFLILTTIYLKDGNLTVTHGLVHQIAKQEILCIDLKIDATRG